MAAAVEPEDEPTSSIPIETFNPEANDFQEWITLFEDAVVLATNVKKEARKKELFKLWLPLVLDDRTRLVFRSCKEKDWKELKKELAKLLVDPQDRYEWRAGRLKITWDRNESFHVLAARVNRAIDKYEEEPRPSDYFHHFRSALPDDYIQAIDLGANEETIDEAMRVALRFRTAQSGKKREPESTFTAASMSGDRMDDLECALERLSAKLENVEEEVEHLRRRLDRLETGRRCAREYNAEDRHAYDENQRDREEEIRSQAGRHSYEREQYDRDRRDGCDDYCARYDYR